MSLISKKLTNDKTNSKLSSFLYGAGILLVIALTVLIDYIFFSAHPDVKSPVDPQHKNAKENVIHKNDTPSTIIKTLEASTTISMANIELPLPPPRQIDADTNYLKSVPSLIEEYAGIPELNIQAQSETKIDNVQDNAGKSRKRLVTLPDDIKRDPSKWQIPQHLVSEKLDQFSTLEGAQRALFFPSEVTNIESTKQRGNSQTQAILNYMHQCIKIDVGAVANNELMLLTKNNRHRSKIMRLASGQYTHKEKALLQTYAPNKKLVRIYPNWFDQNLSRHIALAIGNDSLTQLSGTYQLRKNKLLLTNVRVNYQSQLSDWLLHSNCTR